MVVVGTGGQVEAVLFAVVEVTFDVTMGARVVAGVVVVPRFGGAVVFELRSGDSPATFTAAFFVRDDRRRAPWVFTGWVAESSAAACKVDEPRTPRAKVATTGAANEPANTIFLMNSRRPAWSADAVSFFMSFV